MPKKAPAMFQKKTAQKSMLANRNFSRIECTARIRVKGIMNFRAEDKDFPLFECLYEISNEAIMIMETPRYRWAVRISFKKITDRKATKIGINWNRGVIRDISSIIRALE